MNFIDRTALGGKLAQRVQQFHGKDAVIICLQESSLLTCLTIAKQLRAWVYPLIYAPVYAPGYAHELLGAYGQDGEFFPLPDGPAGGSEIPAKIKKIIKKQEVDAMKSIQEQVAGYGMVLDKHQMDGRDVIIAGDVVISTLPLLGAQQLLKDVSPKSLTAVVGNATPDAAELVRISAGKTEILDILTGVFHDEGHYFEHSDKYTPEQKHTITQHIAAYWQ
jgi:predicted phosphoribosyltransferase